MKSAWKAHLALWGANLIYGANYSLAKEVMPEVAQPSGIIFLRVAGAVLLFFLLWIWKPQMPRKHDWGWFLLCALSGVAVNQLMFFEGLHRTTPIQAALILTLNPVLVILAAAALRGERLTRTKLGGIALGMVGAAVLIVNKQNSSDAPDVLRGNLYIFLNALSYAFYLVWIRRLMARYRVSTVMFWVFLPGLFFITPFSWDAFSAIDWPAVSARQAGILVFIVAGTTFLAYLLNAYALVSVSATVVSAYVYLQPFLASSIAMLLGKDRLSWSMILSAILVFTGVYLVTQPKPLAQITPTDTQ
jgi:drug/metabolite transporter (DMT)-like permease